MRFFFILEVDFVSFRKRGGGKECDHVSVTFTAVPVNQQPVLSEQKWKLLVLINLNLLGR